MAVDLSMDDLRLAWSRVRFDLVERVFIRRPTEARLIELDLDGWLQPLGRRLAAGSHGARPLFVAPVPKGRDLVRPGAWLRLARIVQVAG